MVGPWNSGERVGAVSHADDETLYLFGYGVYEGDFTPPEYADGGPAGWLAMGMRKFGENWTNPRIRLDNGDVVWGCECWWADEEKVKRIIRGRNVVMVSIKEAREEWAEESPP